MYTIIITDHWYTQLHTHTHTHTHTVVNCGDPSQPGNGTAFVVQGEPTFEALALYDCLNGYLLSIRPLTHRTCEADANWSGPDPMCDRKSKGYCDRTNRYS